MGNIPACRKKMEEFHSENFDKFKEMGCEVYWETESYAMRVTWGQPIGLSISYPPDTNAHATPDTDDWVLETALWSVDTHTVVYSSEVDYPDVRRWDTALEVIEEISRLSKLSDFSATTTIMMQ